MFKRYFLISTLTLLTSFAAHGKLLFAETFAAPTLTGWENVALAKQPTSYTTKLDGTNHCLRAVALDSASAFSHHIDFAPPAKLKLRWRWRISGVATNGSERELKSFDHVARVFIAFDTLIGPPRTLNYLWANVEKPGTVLEHPRSSRAQMFILQSGNQRAGQWLLEERDVTADWKKAFPEKAIPKIVALGLMTDSDSLGGKLEADYADLELMAE
jgi:hypothetical protein